MGNKAEPDRGLDVASSPDQTITGGAATTLTALRCGPDGKILVTAHPANTTNIRVSGPDVTTTRGTPLWPGASYSFDVADASKLHAIIESGSGVICVTAT